MSGSLSIHLKEPFPGLAKYESILRRSLPNEVYNCKTGVGYSCLFTNEGLQYEIAAYSPLYPKRGSLTRSALDVLGLRISLMAGLPPRDSHYRNLGAFVLPFRKLAPETVKIRFNLQNSRMEYLIPAFTIPNELAKGLQAYSLVEIFPGFISANAEFADDPSYCEKFFTDPAKCLEDLMYPAIKGMALDDLWIGFEYPKALTFDPQLAFGCSTIGESRQLTLMLPDDINSLDARGNYIHPHVSDELKKSVCQAFNDPML